jgi:hypothetical protein
MSIARADRPADLIEVPGSEARAPAEPLILRLATGRVSPAATRLGWALFGVMLIIGLGQCLMQVTAQDEGELLVYPWLIAHGSMPYRDIWMMYPPSTYLILAALVKAGIPGLVAERGLSLAVRVLFILVVNRTLTGRWSRFSWLGVPLVASLLFYEVNADMRAYPWIVGLPLVWLGLVALRKRPYLAAALFLVAGTFRYEFALAGCIALAALCLGERRQFRERARAAAGLAAGMIGFCLALSALTGGDALQQTIFEPIFDISPGRRLPLVPPHFGWWGIPLELAVLLGPPAMIAAGLLLRRPYLVATNLAALVLVQHFQQRADWIYLLSVGTIVVPWLLHSLIELLAAREDVPRSIFGQARQVSSAGARAARGVMSALGLGASAWYLLLTLVLAVYFSPLSPLARSSVLRDRTLLVQGAGNAIIAPDHQEAVDDRAVIAYLRAHSRPTQRVFVAPRALRYAIWNDTALYFVLDLRPADRYLEMNPGVETRAPVQREIIRDLRHCRWVVLTAEGYWYEPNASHIPGSPLLQRYVHAHYRVVLRNASFQVMERRG